MNKLTIVIIIAIILIIILLTNKQKIELLTNVTTDENTQKEKGALNFLGNNRTQQLDELYENTITFENEEGREGLDMCVEKCKGNCVEFGIHGKAFCFQ